MNILLYCHSERSEESRLRAGLRPFAEPVLERSEGLRVTRLFLLLEALNERHETRLKALLNLTDFGRAFLAPDVKSGGVT